MTTPAARLAQSHRETLRQARANLDAAPRQRAPMNGPSHEQQEHDLTMHVFSISSAMVGVCLTAIGILRLVAAQTNVQTLGDELLSADAVLFVSACFFSFWSIKTRQSNRRRWLRLLVDCMFMLALLVMVGVCTIIAYALA